MKYLFDIGHPFDFHCFKHTIQYLLKNNHQVLVTSRDKEMTLYLLEKSGFTYICTGKNLGSKIGKVYSLFRNDYRIFRAARAFRPDVFVSFFHPFAAHVGKLLGKPVIGFHDTEVAGAAVRLGLPFTDRVVVPGCYHRPLPVHKKITFNGIFELAYLHPNYFTPAPRAFVEEILGLKKPGERYILTRFVSHSALHDSGHGGLDWPAKISLVTRLQEFARVFISSEEELPGVLRPFQVHIPPERMHDVMSYAELLFGESATMAAESAVLGVPAIYLDDQGRGYTDELEEKYQLIFNFKTNPGSQEQALAKAIEILTTPGSKEEFSKRREKFLAGTIDVTAFMIECIEKCLPGKKGCS